MSQKLFYAPNDYVGLEDRSDDYDVSAKRIKTTPEVRQKAEAFIAKSKPPATGSAPHIAIQTKDVMAFQKAKDRTGMNLPTEKCCPQCDGINPFADFTYPSPVRMDSSGCVGYVR